VTALQLKMRNRTSISWKSGHNMRLMFSILSSCFIDATLRAARHARRLLSSVTNACGRNQGLALLLFFLVVAAAGLPAQARTVLDLDSRNQPVALADWGDYWIDTQGDVKVEQVAADPTLGWKPTSASQIYPITTGQVAWVRFNVPPAPDAERWYLEVPNPSINRAFLYTLDGAGRWNEQRAGDTVAVSQWPVPHRYPLLPIALSAEVPTNYLLRLESGHPVGQPLRFISESRLSHSEQRVSLLLGLFFGLAGLAAMISALSAISLRDSAYGWYALAVALLSLTQATTTGLAGLHFWPDWPMLTDRALWVLAALTASAGLMFVSSTAAIPERSKTIHRLLMAGAASGAAGAIALFFIPDRFRPTLLIPIAIVLPVAGVLVLIWAWRRGDRFAPWIALSYLPLMVAVVLALTPAAGWVPVSFWSQHGIQIAVALHLPIVMVTLMLRSQNRRENTRRVQGLDRVDPATGLINSHVFDERLVRMMARSGRLRHESAVMLVDLVNTRQIAQDFGRKAGDELPLRVAQRLLSTAREIDTAARLSEHRFGMLVEGPFSAEDAATLGPRIVARCLMPFGNLPVDCVAQVRVAYALVPREGITAQGLMAQLEGCLEAAPLHGKRAVFMLGDGPQPAHRRPRRRRTPDLLQEIAEVAAAEDSVNPDRP
jgi:two-component system, sensor histidine kinase LadS